MIASSLTRYYFAAYGFNYIHIASTTYWHCLLFDVVIVTDTKQAGCGIFKQFTKWPTNTTSDSDLLSHLQASSASTTIRGYFLHSHIFLRNKTEKELWRLQYAINITLRKKRNLSILLLRIYPNCDISLTNTCFRAFTCAGCIVRPMYTYF